MTTTRILLAAILGGIAMFIWNAIAHMALPLGHAGVSEIPNEEMVLATLKAGMAEKEGLYYFPGMGIGDNPTKEQEKAAMEQYPKKLETNPSGLMVYHPANSRPMAMGKYLTIEFLTEFFETLIVVLLLSMTRISSYAGRVGFFIVAGILAALSTNVSYWNWYGFPGVYTAAYMTMQFVGFVFAGVVAGLVARQSEASA